MPLFYQHNINEHTKLGIWKIEEDEDFFLRHVPLSRDVTHPHKRLQHLAGRYLLPFLFPGFPLSEIIIADTRKPFLENERYHFSISHCADYAAAIVSSTHRVGVDIEFVSPKIERIRHKFLSDEEYSRAFGNMDHLNNILPGIDQCMLTMLWSAKEAAFKWYGNGKVDFKGNMQLNGTITTDHGEWVFLPVVFNKEAMTDLIISSRMFNDLVLSWVMS